MQVPRQHEQIEQMRRDLGEASSMLLDSVDKLLSRGEALDKLEERSEQLLGLSQQALTPASWRQRLGFLLGVLIGSVFNVVYPILWPATELQLGCFDRAGL